MEDLLPLGAVKKVLNGTFDFASRIIRFLS